MKIDCLTTFPEMYESVMSASMMRIAQERGLLDFYAHNLREWTEDPHRTTDDGAYGGGAGQVMMVEPIYKALQDLNAEASAKVIFMAPTGKVFNDSHATRLAGEDQLIFVCGHYEGIDQRAFELADEVFSIGDYVLTGGELASMVMIDATVRKIDGVLGNQESIESESFSSAGLLEHPQYTRPAEFRGQQVPDVLLSGNHAEIEKWRRLESIRATVLNRPDILFCDVQQVFETPISSAKIKELLKPQFKSEFSVEELEYIANCLSEIIFLIS